MATVLGQTHPLKKTLTHIPFNILLYRTHTYVLSVFHIFPPLHFSYFVVPLSSPLQGHCYPTLFYRISPRMFHFHLYYFYY